MKPLALLFAPLFAIAAPLPALAGPTCSFTEECMMTMACKSTDYSLTVDRDKGVLSTEVQDLDILSYDDDSGSVQITARGMGSLNLLTIGANTAILSVHIGAGPMVATYYGSCK